MQGNEVLSPRALDLSSEMDHHAISVCLQNINGKSAVSCVCSQKQMRDRWEWMNHREDRPCDDHWKWCVPLSCARLLSLSLSQKVTNYVTNTGLLVTWRRGPRHCRFSSRTWMSCRRRRTSWWQRWWACQQSELSMIINYGLLFWTLDLNFNTNDPMEQGPPPTPPFVILTGPFVRVLVVVVWMHHPVRCPQDSTVVS